jgi:hypothetical protein
MGGRCAICGRPRIHGAHVKSKGTFSEENTIGKIDNRRHNIIPLCPNHHDEFDRLHNIGIIPDRSGFIIQDGDDCQIKKSLVDLSGIDVDYIEEKNKACTHMVLFRLGMIKGNEHGRMW